MVRKTIVCLALLASAPTLAQSAPQIDCVANGADTLLARDAVDAYLAAQGIGTGPEAIDNRIQSAAFGCISVNPYGSEKFEAFARANISYMMAQEFADRLDRIGYGTERLDRLVVRLIDEPYLDLGEHIDANPELYYAPLDALAAANGLTVDYALAIAIGYVVTRREQNAHVKALFER